MRKSTIKADVIGYSFIFPSFIGFIVFMVYPLIHSFFLSLMDWNMFKGLKGSSFVGIENYKEVLQNEYFKAGIVNNFLFVAMAVPLLIGAALLIAIFLNAEIYGRGILRAMYFMPYVATVTAAAVVFSALFHPTFGPINGALRMLGVENPPGWTASSDYALFTVALFWVWKNIGYCIVIYLAGLQGISKNFYEAAHIDGANSLQQFLYVTVPLVSPTTFFLVVTQVINSFQVFAEVNIMTKGGPGTATTTIVFHIYREAFERFKMGYASSVAWIFFLIIIGVTAIQWLGQKKWVNY